MATTADAVGGLNSWRDGPAKRAIVEFGATDPTWLGIVPSGGITAARAGAMIPTSAADHGLEENRR